MWPNIERIGKKGVKFEENFWSIWGPSSMFYFNQELFNDEKEIKSIYCMYLPTTEVRFKPEEIAMGLCYECDEFGEHTILFSYEENPDIEHKKIWDFCVFPDFSSDDKVLIELYNSNRLMQKGQISEKQMYQRFMEQRILIDFDEDRDTFKSLSKQILKRYGKDEITYTKFLEKIYEKMAQVEIMEYFKVTKEISNCCREGKETDFDTLIFKILNTNTKGKSEAAQSQYKDSLMMIENSYQDNNLNAIFHNARNYFLDKAISYQNVEIDEKYFDEKSLKFMKTGKKQIINETIGGKIEKDREGKPIFRENIKTDKSIKLFSNELEL